MKRMPYEIKQKLRQLAKNRIKGQLLSVELIELFEKHGFDVNDMERISGNSDIEPSNEALTYIENAEGGTEDSINQIEEVFLHIVNNKLDHTTNK